MASSSGHTSSSIGCPSALARRIRKRSSGPPAKEASISHGAGDGRAAISRSTTFIASLAESSPTSSDTTNAAAILRSSRDVDIGGARSPTSAEHRVQLRAASILAAPLVSCNALLCSLSTTYAPSTVSPRTRWRSRLPGQRLSAMPLPRLGWAYEQPGCSRGPMAGQGRSPQPATSTGEAAPESNVRRPPELRRSCPSTDRDSRVRSGHARQEPPAPEWSRLGPGK